MIDVLSVDHVAELGGAEYSLETLVGHLPEDIRITVALPSEGPFADRLRGAGRRVAIVRHDSWRWWVRTPRQRVKFFITFPLQIISLVRWVAFLRRTKPDIVHFNLGRIFEPLVAARILRIPTVVHFRDIPSRQRGKCVLGTRAFFRIMNLANLWVANSAAVADDIREWRAGPLEVVPNGVDLAAFDVDRLRGRDHASWHLRPCTKHVAMVAGINPVKRIELFLDSAAALATRRDDVAFYVVGRPVDADYAAALRNSPSAVQLGDRLSFVGHIDFVPSFVGMMNILVHTTPDEAFGRVFIEAMAAARPVVAIAAGGAMEVVENGKTGILVPEGSAASLADAIDTLLNDETAAETMGIAGRRRVEERYTIDRHSAAIADLYRELAV